MDVATTGSALCGRRASIRWEEAAAQTGAHGREPQETAADERTEHDDGAEHDDCDGLTRDARTVVTAAAHQQLGGVFENGITGGVVGIWRDRGVSFALFVRVQVRRRVARGCPLYSSISKNHCFKKFRTTEKIERTATRKEPI